MAMDSIRTGRIEQMMANLAKVVGRIWLFLAGQYLTKYPSDYSRSTTCSLCVRQRLPLVAGRRPTTGRKSTRSVGRHRQNAPGTAAPRLFTFPPTPVPLSLVVSSHLNPLLFSESTMSEQDEPTFPCKLCGRRFIKSSLGKHESACKKLNSLHRKPFDSGKQRAAGSDVPYSDVKKAAKEKEKMGGVFPRPQTQWRQRHEHFIDAVSASKKVDYAIKTGAPLPPPPRTAVPSDYVQCDYCGRNFNEKAAERHIPFCRDQHKKSGRGRPPPKTPSKPPMSKMGSRDASPSRSRTETRGSGGSDEMTKRRRSLESRAAGAGDRPPPTRSTTQSATHNRQGIPPTPKTRSTSAPRTASRLKQPPTRGETRGEYRGETRGNYRGETRGETRSEYRTLPSRRSTSRSRRS